MNRLIPIVLPLVLLSAFLFGWAFPGRPEAPLGVSRGAGTSVGLTLRPGETTRDAIRFLRTLRSDPLPPPPPPPPPPPVVLPPPPPPDVAVVFKNALSGIERDPATGVYRALVRDPVAPGPQILALSVGDGFADGWRITDVTADAVVLGKGRDVRVVRLYG